MQPNTNNTYENTPINPLNPGQPVYTQPREPTKDDQALALGFLTLVNHNQQAVQPLPEQTYHNRTFLPVQTETEKLEQITNDSMEILISVEAVLPLLIRPNKLVVDRQKLSITHRNIWGSSDTISVQMDDIHNVEAYIGPVFGEIRIYSKYFINNVQRLSGLWRRDAVTIRRLVQGYMIAHNKGVNCSTIEKNHLLKLLTELGRSRH